MKVTQDKLEEKYWIEDKGIRFEFYPSKSLIVCLSDAALLKAIHLVGRCNLDIDWTSFKGRSFQVSYKPTDQWKDFIMNIYSLASKMNSKEKLEKNNLLQHNWDNNKNAPMKYGTLVKSIFDMKKRYEDKKIGRDMIADFFNRYNIEEDEERIARNADILVLQRSKPAKKAIQEGQEALYRLFKKGKLIKLTLEEYREKMDFYDKT